jgi:hypothetical protein
MEYATKFSDFKPEELVGKYVLYESGMTYDDKLLKSICRIVKVAKTSFKIKDDGALFDFNGYQRGLSGRHNMGTISRCTLLTQDEADLIVAQWKQAKEKKRMIESITAALPNLTFAQLNSICAIAGV